MYGMGRILSGRHREQDVADPKSRGARGRYRRVYIMRDVELVFSDVELILRMSPDEELKEHVRRQIARVAPLAGLSVGPSAAGGDGGGGDAANEGAAGAEAAGGGGGAYNDGGESGGGGVDDLPPEDELEKELWG